MSFIDELATEKRRLILKKGVSTLPVRNKPVVSLSDTLKSEGLSFICEVKRASPSEGKIADFDAKELAGTYEQSGASAISVLTEEKHFKGSLADLVAVKETVDIPVLRKDFIVDMRQLDESYAYGADAVLLIVSLLKDETRNYVEKAHEIGLECLVEIHEKDEVEYALDSGAKIIGVNSRNLKNLKVDLGIFDELIPLVKKGRLVVAESGIKNKKDILRVKNAGADAVLIGTSLVKSGSAADMLRELMT